MKKILLSVAFLFATFVGVNAQSITWTQDMIEETTDGVTLSDANGYNIFPGGTLVGTLTAVEITATKVSGTTPAEELAIYVTPTNTFGLGGLLYAGGSSNATVQAIEWQQWPSVSGDVISGTITLDTPITFTATTFVRLVNLYLQPAPGTSATWDNVTVTLYGVEEAPETDYCNIFAGGPYTDFNTTFGGAPTTEGATNEITEFEIWKSEAYLMDGIVAGTEYTFSICNGPGAGSWIPDFTIKTPSGEVDAYGAGDGDGCSITWVATESGTYIIGINEEGNCGVAAQVDNGFPAITNNGVASVDNHLASTFSVYPNPVKDVLNISNNNGAEINSLTIVDINGRTVKQVNSNISQINISDLNAGVYFVNINSTEGNLTKKIVKQ